MKHLFPAKFDVQSRITFLRRVLALLCVSVAIFATLGAIAPGWADGGGFPTPTPTSTQVPPTNTSIPYPYPFSTATSVPYPYPGLLNVNPLAVLTPTPTPAPKTGGFKLGALCWPFAVTFILVVIIASTVFVRGKS